MNYMDKIVNLFQTVMRWLTEEVERRQKKLHLVQSKERFNKSSQFYQLTYSEEFIYDEVAGQIETSLSEHLESCTHWVDNLWKRGLIREDVARDLHRQIKRRNRRILLEKRPAPILPHILKQEEMARVRREAKEVKGPTGLV